MIMRFTANFFLITLFIAFFVIGLFSATSKFQLLVPRFWQKTLESQGIYPKVAAILKSDIETQIAKEGGSKSDIKVITDLITPENVGDFVSKNLEHILNYANAKARTLMVYIPIDKIPKGLIPKNIAGISEEMPLLTLLAKFNFKDITQDQIQWISIVGKTNDYLFILSISLCFITLVFLFLLVGQGKRLIGPGIAFLVSGLIALGLAFVSSRPHVGEGDIVNNLIGVLAPPILAQISRIWMLAGIGAVVMGVILFLVKRPQYNVKR